MAEFDLIRGYFSTLTASRDDVLLGVGDDCALMNPPADRVLAMTQDTLIAGRHFLPATDAESVGHKALAVNLSDLAAMGAEPAWALLSLSLPEADGTWLNGFCRGFAALAGEHGVQLVGGDTCRGGLSITVQLTGFVEPGRALRRDGARPGDLICVTGTLGDAALALRRLLAGEPAGGLRTRLERPAPRVTEGRSLRNLASACIDLSDGLAADLGHICTGSNCAARVLVEKIPLSAEVAAFIEESADWQPVIAGGDDYELCFTVPPDRLAAAGSLPGVACIGEIVAGEGVGFIDRAGGRLPLPVPGYDHFAS